MTVASQSFSDTKPSRRTLLRKTAVGFGFLALADLLTQERTRSDVRTDLAPRSPHFPPRAQRIIFLFMHGGPSQVDTFDYKPQLIRDDNKPLPFSLPRVVSAETFNLLKSPFSFAQYGDSGAWISELFPHLARHADELTFVRSVHGSNSRHGAALLELHTGSDTFIRPSLGSWLGYGLGTENRNLPSYITICPSLTHGGTNNWSSAFLPAVYAGTPMGNAGTPSSQARFPFIHGPTAPDRQRRELDLLQQMNHRHLARSGPDAELESRIRSFELAFRLQREAPLVQDLSDESPHTLSMYGIDQEPTADFGRQCLMARRFAERGVRFIQLSHSYKWDQHSNLKRDHRRNALEVDRPIAALLTDLRQRGLLEDTLVWWGGEFGRTPVSQAGRDGRDHNPHAMTMWFAGGGMQPGLQYGETDEYGYYAVKNKVHFHDLHATILHLMGLDHERLTFRHAGRDFRLTDVHGEVVHDILA